MSREHWIAAAARRGFAIAMPAWFAAAVTASVIGAVLLLGASGCRRAADFSAYREQAVALAGRTAPELEALSRRLPALVRRAGQLPAATPGMGELQKRLARNRGDASALESAIRGLPGKVGSAVKTGKPEEVEKLLFVARAELEASLVALRAELDATAAEVGRVEDAAREAVR